MKKKKHIAIFYNGEYRNPFEPNTIVLCGYTGNKFAQLNCIFFFSLSSK